MSTENLRHTRLQKLSDSDFEMVDGEPDIRGWDVKDNAGKQYGEVDELIFDYDSRKVRYLVVALEENDFGFEDKKVLVPIGIAELKANDDDVLLPNVTVEQIQSLPEYKEDNFGTEDESNIRNVFGGLGATAATIGSTNADFYNHEHFNEDNLYRNRNNKQSTDEETTIPIINEELVVNKKDVTTGGIRLRSRIVEREVAEDIKLREENVRVERTPVDRIATASDLREETIEMKQFAEVPTVSREAHIVEEISLKKDISETTQTVRDTVRNTEVDVDNNNDINTSDKISSIKD